MSRAKERRTDAATLYERYWRALEETPELLYRKALKLLPEVCSAHPRVTVREAFLVALEIVAASSRPAA